MKKIVLIEARSPDYHVFSRYHLPRLGTVLLGTILENEGHYVSVYVEDIEEIDFVDVFDADIIGISTITSTAPRAYEIADQLKKHGKTVVMGGPHVTFLADEALEHCHYVIRGEGEESVVALINAIEAGKGLDSVPGLSFKVGNTVFHNPDSGLVKDLNKFPIPDFSMIKGMIKGKVWPVLTSRGCPYDCTFCSVTKIFGRGYRYRSKENVLRELRAIPPGGLIFFYDDNFTANPGRTKELLRMMIKEGIKKKWTAQVRVDVARDPELLDLMQESNCFYVYIGFESVNPDTLQQFNKQQTLEEMKLSIHELHRRNIRIHGMFVVGSDQDTPDTLKATATFAKKNKIDTVQFMILTPLPGSRNYDDLKASDRILTDDWSLYDAHHVVYEPKGMTPFELQVGTLRAMGSFYSRMEIIKMVLRRNFLGAMMKYFGVRLTRKWIRKNKYFYEVTREMTLNAGRRIEISAKRTAEDIKEKISSLKALGRLPSLPQLVQGKKGDTEEMEKKSPDLNKDEIVKA